MLLTVGFFFSPIAYHFAKPEPVKLIFQSGFFCKLNDCLQLFFFFFVSFSQNDSVMCKNNQREAHLLVGLFVFNGFKKKAALLSIWEGVSFVVEINSVMF